MPLTGDLQAGGGIWGGDGWVGGWVGGDNSTILECWRWHETATEAVLLKLQHADSPDS